MEIGFCRARRDPRCDRHLAHKLLTLLVASTARRFGVVAGPEMRVLS
jgi:hypothetical protein